MLSSSINPSGIPTIIADNFCTQLLAFQNAIFARPAGDQIPTQQEINMQTKLLSNIIKIKKLNATDHVAKFMTTFCRFLGKDDKEQAQTIAGKFMQFMGIDSTENDIAIQETVIAETNPFEASPLQAEPQRSIYPEFEKNKHLLEDYRYGSKDSEVQIGEKIYNKQCVEYNLLQYTLPEESRRFIPDPGEYHKLIDHEQTKKQIIQYLRARVA